MVLHTQGPALLRSSGERVMSLLALFGAASGRIAELPGWFVGLLVGVIGAAGATWYYQGAFSWWHLIAYLVVAGAALFIGWLGERRVSRDPVQGVRMIGARTFATLLVAGLATALVVAVTLEIAPAGDKPTDESKELFGTLSAAIAAAITGSLIKVSESIDGPAADSAKAAVSKAFAAIDKTSRAGQSVFLEGYQGKFGWGPAERVWRAEQAATTLPESGGASAAV